MSKKSGAGQVIAVAFFLLFGGASAQNWETRLKEAEALYSAQNPDSALVIGKKALKEVEDAFGPADTTTALVLYHLGVFSMDAGMYDDAISSLERALKIQEEMIVSGSMVIGATKYYLGSAYLRSAEYTQAEDLLRAALVIYRSQVDETDERVGRCILELANVERAVMKWPEAIIHYGEAQALFERLPKHDNYLVARTLIGLGKLYMEMGKYGNADAAFRNAISIWEKIVDPLDYELALTYEDLACSLREQARFVESEEYHKKALGIFAKILKPDHPDLSPPLCNLATLYCDLRKFAEAESLYARALAIEVKAYGRDDLKVAETLDLLAGVYFDTGRYEEAEDTLKQCLAIKRRGLPHDHYYIATNLTNLADVNTRLQDYAEAECCLMEALEIYKAASTEETHDAAAAILGLANNSMMKQNYARSDSLSTEALAIYTRIYGPDHLDVALALETLASSKMLQRNVDRAIVLGDSAFSIRWKNFQNNGYILPESDALNFSAQLREAADLVFSFYFALPRDAKRENSLAARRVADIALASKGNVSDIIFERQRTLAAENDSVTRELENSYKNAKLQLSELFAQKPIELSQRIYRRQLDSLQNVIDQIEAALNRHSESFREKRRLGTISGDRLCKLLPQGTVLVEYLKCGFHGLTPGDSQSYYMAVILGSDGARDLVKLGDASSIDSLVSRYCEHMSMISSRPHAPLKSDMPEYRRIARKLYDVLISPLESQFVGKNLVFIAPDGALNSVSFAGLVDKKGRYLIEGVPIHYLSAGRELVRLEHRSKSGSGLFALGDPDFDARPIERPSRISAPSLAVIGEDAFVNRIAQFRLGEMRGTKLARLFRSRTEVKEIVKAWRRVTKEPVVELLGGEASEDNFLAQAPGNRVIHLATHGYFYEANSEHGPSEVDPSVALDATGLNPLLLSGLFLAGANQKSDSAHSVEINDGILTAYEVSAMNLNGTDVVVLSACESGLGAIRSGEGVYGLHRAFEMAGARTIVSALWAVPEAATAGLMAQLYAHSDKPIPDRIRRAQINQINKLRTEGFADHPYGWAAFVVIGDWR